MRTLLGIGFVALMSGASAHGDITQCQTSFGSEEAESSARTALVAECVSKINACEMKTRTIMSQHAEASLEDADNMNRQCAANVMQELSVKDDQILAADRARAREQSSAARQDSTGANGASASATAPPDIQPLADQCDKEAAQAKNFCSDPISYSSDGGVSQETAGVAVQLGMMAGSIAKSDQGVNGFCNMGATTGASLAGLNGTFAGRCSSFISDCEKSCGHALETAKNAQKNNTPVDYGTIIKAIQTDHGTCTAQKRKAAELTSQASANATGAMMSKLCANASKATTVSAGLAPPVVPVPQSDCSGANATSPLCRAPGSGGSGGGAGAGFDYAGGAGGSGKESGMNVNDIDTSGTQAAKTDPTTGAAATNAGVPNGGGQMLGGNGQGGGGGGGDEKGRPAGPGGNANVLQGERGGGGYSVSQGGAAGGGGGWSGYGGGTPSDVEKREKFDLSKYLPGGKNAPARGPAGLARAGGEIAAPHEDIFKKISDRVQVVCRTNRLMDCN